MAHCAVENSRLDNLPYVHSIVPDILSSVNDNLESVLHHCWHRPESFGFSTAVHDYTMKKEVFTDEKEANVVNARRLLLRAGASSRYPGNLEELNYGERRTALLCFFGAATKVTIFSRISLSAAGPELMRMIVSFL